MQAPYWKKSFSSFLHKKSVRMAAYQPLRNDSNNFSVCLEPLSWKMFSRRNLLLRCSILINIVVILYVASHLIISNGNNFQTSGSVGPAPASYLLQETGAAEQLLQTNSARSVTIKSNVNDDKQQLTNSGAAAAAAQVSPVGVKDDLAPELDPNVGDPAQFISNAGTSAAATSSSGFNAPNNAVAVAVAAAAESNDTNAVDAQSSSGGDEKELLERLRALLKCYDRPYKPETLQRGDFWVLKNYVRAEHAALKCQETITYTTHADYTFLDNLIPLLERWNAPVSIAMHAPGADFQPTLNSIKYLRNCLPGSVYVRKYATFHIYFDTKHIPRPLPKAQDALKSAYNCSAQAPYFNVSESQLFKTQKKLLYPVNVGRNIARDAALTHFILASDIELYPNPGLVKKFLEMIARNEGYLRRKAPRVFPLPIFEVRKDAIVPRDKTELQKFLHNKKAIPFHQRVCASCHNVPKAKEWIVANETDELSVFHIGKRTGSFDHWEPIYIGTHDDPYYEERLSWEGKSDKMTQGYTLCVLDYEFHILDNAFLVHRPGIKVLTKDQRRAAMANKTNQLIRKIIYPELLTLYGARKGCTI